MLLRSLFKEFLVNLLNLKNLFHAAANIEADHQPCQLFAADRSETPQFPVLMPR
jgi:hypothetical protein